jgi:hypothetical protein
MRNKIAFWVGMLASGALATMSVEIFALSIPVAINPIALMLCWAALLIGAAAIVGSEEV